MLSTDRWSGWAALLVFAGLALWLLRDGLATDVVMISGESLQRSLPWSATLDEVEPHNRFIGDQPRIYYPYLLEAARVYADEVGPLWTSRGGGGVPFLGNMTSSLLHPLTLLAAVFPVHWVPLLQGLAVLVLSSAFTWLFLRRLHLSVPAATFGAVAFGFGGHQIFWLQYALSHTLVALPFTFWATERVLEDRSRRRLAVLALGFAMLVLGGHPETGFVAGMVAGLWALWRLWDAHGRWLLVGVAFMALGLSAVQWLTFLEYAQLSHGLKIREMEGAHHEAGVSFGAGVAYAVLLLMAAAMLRNAAERGFVKRVMAVVGVIVAIVMARRMGMNASAITAVLPEWYGNPIGGRPYNGAEDFPGLCAGYVGVMPPILLGLGFFVGAGGGFVRFFGLVAMALWGAAHNMPAIDGLVHTVPGLAEVAPTRLLGAVGFVAACGGAKVLDILCGGPDGRPGMLKATGRVAMTGLVSLVASIGFLSVSEPDAGNTIVAGLLSPDHQAVHDGRKSIRICFELEEHADDLRVLVDGQLLWSDETDASKPGEPFSLAFLAQRAEEGIHRLQVEAWRGGRPELIADQPLVIRRDRSLSERDLVMIAATLLLLGWLVTRLRTAGAWPALVLVVVDVVSLGADYNVATPLDQVFPETETTRFLREQPGPFRIFTEGNILPPDTQFAEGVDHLLTYDNLWYHRTYQWLIHVPIQMDNYATYSFSRDSVDYGSPRFDTLDVRYVITGYPTRRDPKPDLSEIPGMRLVHEAEALVWENTDNLGRAWLAGEWMNVHTHEATDLIAADPRSVVLLEEDWPEPVGGGGQAQVLSHRGDEIRVAVEADGPAMLVLSENWAPGWEASIDGGAFIPTRPADVTWQAVPVAAGNHDVVFRYAPLSYRWGAWISLIALAIWVLMLVMPRHLS